MPVTVRVIPFPLSGEDLSNAQLMRELGDLAVSVIRKRTEQGTDVSGAPFLPLSESYANARQKAGYGTRSNLTLSGGMLGGLRVIEATDRKVTLGFTGDSPRAGRGGTLVQRSREVGGNAKAFWHNVTGAGKSRAKRKFFDLSVDERVTLAERLMRFLSRTLKGRR